MMRMVAGYVLLWVAISGVCLFGMVAWSVITNALRRKLVKDAPLTAGETPAEWWVESLMQQLTDEGYDVRTLPCAPELVHTRAKRRSGAK